MCLWCWISPLYLFVVPRRFWTCSITELIPYKVRENMTMPRNVLFCLRFVIIFYAKSANRKSGDKIGCFLATSVLFRERCTLEEVQIWAVRRVFFSQTEFRNSQFFFGFFCSFFAPFLPANMRIEKSPTLSRANKRRKKKKSVAELIFAHTLNMACKYRHTAQIFFFFAKALMVSCTLWVKMTNLPTKIKNVANALNSY